VALISRRAKSCITRRSKDPEYRRFLKYQPADNSLAAKRELRGMVSRRCSMKRLIYLGLAVRLFVAAVSPASGTPALNVGPPHQAAGPMKLVSSVHPWTSGSETATLPWAAPRGHHQPRLADVPASPASDGQDLNEDARIDRIVRDVCRNC
jgi:hypothetical protein